MTDEQTTDDLIKQINAHPRSALIEALADAMHSIEDDDGNGRHISYYRSLAFATVEVLPALSYDENELCNEPGCGAHRPAGPAPSSASPSGTGGNRPDVEGRHREAWHQLVEAWHGIELHPTSSNSAHMQRRYAEGALVMYLTLTGQDEDTVLPEIGRALDDLYGAERDKRGVPC